MKDVILNNWIKHEAVENMQTHVKADSPNIGIMELYGENVFITNKPKGFYAMSLLVTEGEINFIIKDEKTVITAPAYIEFVFITEINEIKTTSDFKGVLTYIDDIFFKKTTENIRFTLSKVIYYYSKKPFVLLRQEEKKRILKYIDFLSDSINQKGNIFSVDINKNILQALLYEVWNVILHTFKCKGNNVGYIEDDIIGSFMYLVNTYCREHHMVKWYAEQLFVSPDALSAKLRKTYGKNANKIIDETLAAEAKICLSDEHYSIQDVAEILNFSDQASFSRFFKRNTGLSPSEFKKSNNT